MTEYSQNGYSVLDSLDDCKHYNMPNGGSIPLRKGAAGYVLAHFARRFHKQIENLNKADCYGYSRRLISGSTDWSNHASGTAIDLNATKHAQGQEDTFNPEQELKLRDLLARYDGLIKWGGDFRVTKDEMHFELLSSSKKEIRALAARLMLRFR